MSRLVFLAVVLKGVIITTVLKTFVNATIVESIAVAATSATITGIFVLISAYITRKEVMTKIEQPIQDIAGKVQADRRADDVIRDNKQHINELDQKRRRSDK